MATQTKSDSQTDTRQEKSITEKDKIEQMLVKVVTDYEKSNDENTDNNYPSSEYEGCTICGPIFKCHMCK